MYRQQKKILIAALIFLTTFAAIGVLFSQNSTDTQNKNLDSSEQSKEVKKIKQLELSLSPINDYTQTGKVELEALPGGKTKVILTTTIATSSAQPTYIHNGNCANIGDRKILLINTVSGKSVSIVDHSINELTATPSAVVVHHSLAKFTTYTACADIKS